VFKSSGNKTLDDTAVASLKASRFEPGTEDGKPVRVCGYKLTMAWEADNAPAPAR
jgi:outer membrane biosynthesis protein TonB